MKKLKQENVISPAAQAAQTTTCDNDQIALTINQVTSENALRSVARICFSNSLYDGKGHPCTVKHMLEIMQNPLVHLICDALRTINNMNWCDNQTLETITSQSWAQKLIQQEEKRMNKGRAKSLPRLKCDTPELVFAGLKHALPLFMFHSQRFENDDRQATKAVPSKLYMLDLDDLETPVQVAKTAHLDDPAFCQSNRIAYVGITPSYHGLRVVAELADNQTIEQAQNNLARFIAKQVLSATSISVTEQDINQWCDGVQGDNSKPKHFDTSCTDLSRASLAVSEDHIIYLDKTLLQFSSQADADKAAQTAAIAARNYTQQPNTTYTSTTTPLTIGTTTSAYPDTYITDDGTPVQYADIAANLLKIKNKGRTPQPGERNSTIYRAAHDLRTICGDNPLWIYSIMPDLGLSQTELQQCVNNAFKRDFKPEKTKELCNAISMAKMLNNSTTTTLQNEEIEEVEEVQNLDPNKIPIPPLPEVLQLLTKYVPPVYRWAVIMSCLPQLGALLSLARFYDGQTEHALSFITFVFGPQSGQKGTMITPAINCIQKPIREEDDLIIEQQDKYRDDVELLKNSENQPVNPHVEPRIINTSAGDTAVIDALIAANGKAVVGYAAEIDDFMAGMKKGSWTIPKAALKNAFDRGMRGVTYKSHTKKQVPYFFNLTATGTENCLGEFFDKNDMQGGLCTRIIAVPFPYEEFQKKQYTKKYTNEDYERIIHLCRMYNQMEGGTYKCGWLDKWLNDWAESKRQIAQATRNYALNTLHHRASIIGWRAGYMAAIMAGIATLDGDPKPKLTKELKQKQKDVIAFAQAVAEYTLQGQLYYFGEQMQTASMAKIKPSCALNQYQSTTGLKAVLLRLDDEFTQNDVFAARLDMGYTQGDSRDITRMTKNGLAEKFTDENGETKFRKTAKAKSYISKNRT